MNNIVLIGPQGSGKGTQAERLSAKLGIPIVSVGRLFREEVERDTGPGRSIARYISKGERVPSEIVDQVVSARLQESAAGAGIIVDGYPRTLEQAATLDKIFGELGRKVTHVIDISVPDEVSLKRLSGRWVCSNLKCEENYHAEFNPPKKNPDLCDKCGSPLIQRDDDKPDAIKRRLEIFHKDTEPLIAYFRDKGLLYGIDGNQPIDKVAADIAAIFA